MTEYDVKKALGKRGKQNTEASAAQSINGIPNSVLADVFSGKRGATGEMMGHRQDLAPSIAAKMSQSFGMDFSAVQLYRSDAMAGTELHGMAQGNKVVLSSDVDLNTMEGQAILGHELSHIRAQSMGMGTGRSGLLESAALEHQADSEGMLAARGMNISGESMGMTMGLGMAGMDGLSPVGAGLGASAAAPMQANKDKNQADPEQSSGEKWSFGSGVKKGLASWLSTVTAPLRLAGAAASMAAAPFTLASQAYDQNVHMKKGDKLSAGDHIGNFFKGAGGFLIDTLSTIANAPGAILGGLGNLGLAGAQKLNYSAALSSAAKDNKAINKKGSHGSAKSGFDDFIRFLPTMGYHMAQKNFNNGSEKTLLNRASERWHMGSLSPETGFLHNRFFNFLRNTGNRKKKRGLLTPLNMFGRLFTGNDIVQNERVFGNGQGEASKRAEEDFTNLIIENTEMLSEIQS